MDEKLIMGILNSKENRRILQTKLIDKYKNTLISFTLNIPGVEKDNENYRKIHRETMGYILNKLGERDIKILYNKSFERTTGAEGYIVVEKPALDIKFFMIEIEERNYLGRLFDIDVFDKGNQQVSRRDLNIDGRNCLICKKDARICMREKNHSQEELLLKVDNLIEGYFDLTKKSNCEIIDV